MPQIDLPFLCTAIGNMACIPIRIYEVEKLIFSFYPMSLARDPITPHLTSVLAIRSSVGYYITPEFHSYGVVTNKNQHIVIGPAWQTPPSEQELHTLAFHLDVPRDDIEDFIQGMKQIVPMPLDSILQIMLTMHHVLSGEKLSLKDVHIYDTDQEELKKRLEVEKEKQAERQEESVEIDPFNNSLALEQTLMNIVRHGDTQSLMQWVSQAPPVHGGVLADNQLRQMKNTFIVTATLVCRNAIRGGVDAQDALALSDAYIQKCEMLSTLPEITNLQYRMVIDYTERVERIRHGKTASKLAAAVTNYVLHHLSESIKTSQIADALFLSRSRLSTRFREETGQTLTDYIMREKIHEAKRLLRYTDKSIAAISEYLGFSSQSHFNRIFRRYGDLTPGEYREKKQ